MEPATAAHTPPPAQRRGRLSRCPNCGAPLTAFDNFCPRCGQENHDLRLPFRHLLLETVEGLLHLDSKSFRTVKALVLKPGFLSAEFSAGRRVSYVAPVRLYIFISFLFFLVLSLGSSSHAPDGAEPASGAERNQMNLSFYSIDANELKGLNPAQLDSLMEAHGIERSRFNRFVAAQLSRIAAGGKTEFSHLLLKGVSYMMFVLMPLFALLLLLFYRRKGTYYLDHLIFSIHFHSFAFLLLTLYVVTSRFTGSLVPLLIVVLLIGAYLILSLRTVYRQPTGITLLKAVSIGSLHIVALCGCFVLTVLLSILAF